MNLTVDLGVELKRKVLIAIDSTLKEPYISITKLGPLATWAKKLEVDLDLVVYYSKSPSQRMIWLNKVIEEFRWRKGRYMSYLVSYLLMWCLWPLRLFVPRLKPSTTLCQSTAIELKVLFLEALFLQRWKKLSIIKYFVTSHEHDFLLMITPSCYINQRNLLRYVQNLPIDKPLYRGSVQAAHDGPFVAGGTLILNKKAGKLLLKNRYKIPTHLMDDVAFGVTMNRLAIELTSFPFLNLDSVEQIQFKDLIDHFYIRVAQGPLHSREDVRNMKKLHAILESN